MRIIKRAFAKINLTLDVLNKREDGYHNIASVMQSLSLCDTVTIERVDSGISVSWNIDEPPNDKNTAYRAAKLIIERYGLKNGVKIVIDKKIPVAAGLGGGSADAAAVISGLNELFGLNIELPELMSTGSEIGADVPFCLMNGAAIAEGIGDKLLRLDAGISCRAVLIKPGVRVSTKDVYSKIDKLILIRRPNMGMAAEAVRAGDLRNLGQNLYNVMELVTAAEYPIIKTLKQEMMLQGACGALMSGSGPTVYGIFENGIQAENAYAFFKSKYTDFESFICELYFPRDIE